MGKMASPVQLKVIYVRYHVKKVGPSVSKIGARGKQCLIILKCSYDIPTEMGKQPVAVFDLEVEEY
jgi:hypothetical protein